MKKKYFSFFIYFFPFLIVITGLSLIITMLLIGCTTIGKFDCPYEVSATIFDEGIENVEDWDGNVSFSFLNKTEKKISSFEVVINLYDWNGEPVLEEDFESYSIKKEVLPWQSIDSFVFVKDSMTDYGADCCSLWIDYFYVSSITYEDGTVWEDPLGRYGV